MANVIYTENAYLAHYGIKGQKKGVRRFQNEDGSLTAAGERRYNENGRSSTPTSATEQINKNRTRTPGSAYNTVRLTSEINSKNANSIYGRKGERSSKTPTDFSIGDQYSRSTGGIDSREQVLYWKKGDKNSPITDSTRFLRKTIRLPRGMENDPAELKQYVKQQQEILDRTNQQNEDLLNRVEENAKESYQREQALKKKAINERTAAQNKALEDRVANSVDTKLAIRNKTAAQNKALEDRVANSTGGDRYNKVQGLGLKAQSYLNSGIAKAKKAVNDAKTAASNYAADKSEKARNALSEAKAKAKKAVSDLKASVNDAKKKATISLAKNTVNLKGNVEAAKGKARQVANVAKTVGAVEKEKIKHDISNIPKNKEELGKYILNKHLEKGAISKTTTIEKSDGSKVSWTKTKKLKKK